MSLNLGQLQANARQAGWPESEIAKSAAIAMYESGGNPKVLNDGSRTHTTEHSVGLYQINTLAHHGYSIAQLQDPLTNAQIALQIWRGRPNYRDWVTSNGKYNNDYKGIASQSRAIYAAGGGQLVDTGNVQQIVDSGVAGSVSDSANVVFYIVAAGGLMLLLSKR